MGLSSARPLPRGDAIAVKAPNTEEIRDQTAAVGRAAHHQFIIHQDPSFRRLANSASPGGTSWLLAGNPEDPLQAGGQLAAEPRPRPARLTATAAGSRPITSGVFCTSHCRLGRRSYGVLEPFAAFCKTKSGMILRANGPKIKSTASEQRRPIGFWKQSSDGTSERISPTQQTQRIQPKVSPFRPLLGWAIPFSALLVGARAGCTCRAPSPRPRKKKPTPSCRVIRESVGLEGLK